MARARLALSLGFGLAIALALLCPVTLGLARRDRRSRPALRLKGRSAATSPFRSTTRIQTGASCASLSPRNRRRTTRAARSCCSPAGRARLRPRCSTSRPTSGHHYFRATTSRLRRPRHGRFRGAFVSRRENCRAVRRAIGPRRVFYGTRENVADMEAVRRALGVDRIALFGLSYGTKQALAYARAHPRNVDRLLLDSVVPVDGPEPLGLDTLRGISDALRSICHDGPCAGRDPAADFARLGEQARGPSPRGAGSRLPDRLGADAAARAHRRARAAGLAITSDLNTGIAVALPAAVRAALEGRPKHLEHLAALIGEQSTGQVNNAVLFATMCNDGPFPWRSETPLSTSRAPRECRRGSAAGVVPRLRHVGGTGAGGGMPRLADRTGACNDRKAAGRAGAGARRRSRRADAAA